MRGSNAPTQLGLFSFGIQADLADWSTFIFIEKKCKLASFQFKPLRGPAIYSARIPSTALFRANSQRHFWIALSKNRIKAALVASVHQQSKQAQKWKSSSSSSLSSPQSQLQPHQNITSKLFEHENTTLQTLSKLQQFDKSKILNDDDHLFFDGYKFYFCFLFYWT